MTDRDFSQSINNAAKPFGLKHLPKNRLPYPSTTPTFDNSTDIYGCFDDAVQGIIINIIINQKMAPNSNFHHQNNHRMARDAVADS